MKESAQAAFTYSRLKAVEFGIKDDFYQKNDIHIHVPEGAIPKDGPSAGVTMLTAMISALAKLPVRTDLAMTGEITLRGRVLPVGGIREKALAALANGIKTVILPYENNKDLEDLPDYVKEKISFVMVKNVDEILNIAFEKPTVRKKSGSANKKRNAIRPSL